MTAPDRSSAADDPDDARVPDPSAGRRLAWAVTGSGHYLEESLAIAATAPDIDLFLSAAAEEVLPIYGRRIEDLRQQFKLVRDKTASSVPVGALYEGLYHTLVIAPATSNTVAKCAFGISDSLPTNMFAQAGKLGIPSIVFACDTAPVVVTRAPKEWVTLYPRRIELENVDRLRGFEHCRVVCTPEELQQAIAERLAELG